LEGFFWSVSQSKLDVVISSTTKKEKVLKYFSFLLTFQIKTLFFHRLEVVNMTSRENKKFSKSAANFFDSLWFRWRKKKDLARKFPEEIVTSDVKKWHDLVFQMSLRSSFIFYNLLIFCGDSGWNTVFIYVSSRQLSKQNVFLEIQIYFDERFVPL
jgi:hypothetical protein